MAGNSKTPKKAAVATVSPSRKKGNFTKRIKSYNSSKPSQQIDVYQTKVANVVVAVVSRPGNAPKSSFIHPFEVQFNSEENGLRLADRWKIFGFFPRSKDGINTLKGDPAKDYDWKAVVGSTDDFNDDAALFGKNLAKSWTSFAKNTKLSGMESPDNYVLRSTFTNEPQPLNSLLLNADCAKLLASIYSDYSQEELMDDDDLMAAFFGDAKTGRNYMDDIDEDEWNDLLD